MSFFTQDTNASIFALCMRSSLLFILIGLTQFKVSAQDCDCTVLQVQENTVESCNLVVGEIIEVSTVPALRSAISQANDQGGNITILIADGTYPIASTASFPYITGDNVVIRSLNGNRNSVTITGEGMRPTDSTENGFLIAGNNVTIADLTIKEVGNHGIQVSGHHLTVHNVKIQDTYEQMVKGSSYAETIENGLVKCSLFEYTAGEGPNWYIGGLDIHKGINWTVQDNVFRNISSPGYAISEHAVHFWNNSRDNTIERNMIYNCDRGIGFGLGNYGPQNSGGIIRNNMIYNDGTGLFNDVGIGLESSPNTRVYNNTIQVEYQNAIEFRFPITDNVIIANNLTNRPITSRDGGTASEATNFEEALLSWYEFPITGNLRLTTAIPELIDQGSDLGTDVTVDIDHNPRPMGEGIDIGAQEWLVSSSVNIATKVSLSIIPNPASQEVVIKTTKDLSQAQINIYDLTGKLLYTSQRNSGSSFTIDISSFTSGSYLVSLKEKNKIISQNKLVIQ